MGNIAPNGNGMNGTVMVKRIESFGSPAMKGTRKTNYYFGSSERISSRPRSLAAAINRPNRSQSLEQSGAHSPTSSRSSSSNSYVNSVINGASTSDSKPCLRQSATPKFRISGDLTPQQAQIIKRTWKQVMKSVEEDETEIAVRLLLRIFHLDPRNQVYFSLEGVTNPSDLRHNPLFLQHVKAFSPTLLQIMTHPTNATSLSKYLQSLGGRHVFLDGLTYKSAYWKTFVQALVDVVGADTAEVFDAYTVLGAFCVEQMRIGYKIEYKLQREAERLLKTQ